MGIPLGLTGLMIGGSQGGGAASSILTGLFAYYKLNEVGPGARADSLAVANLTDSGLTGSTTGKVGLAANFAGTTQLSVTPFTLSGGSFSVAGWFKPSASGLYGLWGKATAGSGHEFYVTGRFDTGRFSLNCWNGAGYTTAEFLITLTIGNWYWIYVEYNAALQTISINVNNGVMVSTAFTSGIQVRAVPFVISSTESGFSFIQGAVDELGVWSRILTPTEQTNLYNGGNGRTYPF